LDGYAKTVKKAQTALANLLDSLIELRVNMVNQVGRRALPKSAKKVKTQGKEIKYLYH
jgi:hypothetical protein